MNYVDFNTIDLGNEFITERETRGMTHQSSDGHLVYHLCKKTGEDISECYHDPTPCCPSLGVFPDLIKKWKDAGIPVVQAGFHVPMFKNPNK